MLNSVNRVNSVGTRQFRVWALTPSLIVFLSDHRRNDAFFRANLVWAKKGSIGIIACGDIIVNLKLFYVGYELFS